MMWPDWPRARDDDDRCPQILESGARCILTVHDSEVPHDPPRQFDPPTRQEIAEMMAQPTRMITPRVKP